MCRGACVVGRSVKPRGRVWAGWENEGLGLPWRVVPKFTPHTLA